MNNSSKLTACLYLTVILTGNFRESFHSINPNNINPTNLVELQVSFMAVIVKKGEYVFLPKLRSICILDRLVERVSIYYITGSQAINTHFIIGLQHCCHQDSSQETSLSFEEDEEKSWLWAGRGGHWIGDRECYEEVMSCRARQRG